MLSEWSIYTEVQQMLSEWSIYTEVQRLDYKEY